MVRAFVIRLPLVALALWSALTGCTGPTAAFVVDTETGCCVLRRFNLPSEASSATPCTCSCDGGACKVDQPIGLNVSDFNQLVCSAGESALPLTVDLSCETWP